MSDATDEQGRNARSLRAGEETPGDGRAGSASSNCEPAAVPNSPSAPAPPPLPWLVWKPGERVVVRYRLPDGLHDALGTLIEVDPHYVVVDTRRGPVRVAAATMVTGKRVPPAPARG